MTLNVSLISSTTAFYSIAFASCRMAWVQHVRVHWACPVLTSRTKDSFFFFFKAASLIIEDIKNDGSEEESPWLKRNQTDPLPDRLSWGPRPSWFSKKSPPPPHSLRHSPPVQPHCNISEHANIQTYHHIALFV